MFWDTSDRTYCGVRVPTGDSSTAGRGSQEVPFGSKLPFDDGDLIKLIDRIALRRSLVHLSAREHPIVRLRFGDSLSQSEIAARVGIAQIQVSRLIARSLERLHHHLRDNPL